MKLMRISAVGVLVLLMLCLTACRGIDEKMVGKYDCVRVVDFGGSRAVDGQWLELRKDGTGSFYTGKTNINTYELKWTGEEGSFHAKVFSLNGEQNMDGFFLDGVIQAIWKDSTLTFTQNAQAWEEEPVALEGVAGSYAGYSTTSDGNHMSHEEMSAIGLAEQYRLWLFEDGSGAIDLPNEPRRLLTYNEEENKIVLENGWELPYSSDYDYLLVEIPPKNQKVWFTRVENADQPVPQQQLTEIPSSSKWYGWLSVTGREIATYDVRATYSVDQISGKTFFEVYRTNEAKTTLLSMFVETQDNRMLKPVIHGNDAILLGRAIPAEEAGRCTITLLTNGSLYFYYEYTDNGTPYSVGMCLRQYGTKWDSADDRLPPNYDAYLAEIS